MKCPAVVGQAAATVFPRALPGSSGRVQLGLAAAVLAVLAGCGGGAATTTTIVATSGGDPRTATATVSKPENAQQANRFLTQATFGPTDAEVQKLSSAGYAAWIDDQLDTKTHPVDSLTDYWRELTTQLAAVDPKLTASQADVIERVWQHALAGDTQLRDRVAYALSQIFVVSLVDTNLSNGSLMVASYYDMLADKGFTTYRELLEAVTLHPAMGTYLSHLKSQGEDAKGIRVPDQNYAREVMQLFSIGLYELNQDGSLKTGADGKPIETYGPTDILGLSRVFTGWSWAYSSFPDDQHFFGFKTIDDIERFATPMMAYPQYHSWRVKTFLGKTIPEGQPADNTPLGVAVGAMNSDLKVALDTLANHPNVGPFLGKQLIQRLVTSNPSPAYVGRVAAAFNDNGHGVRGDMKAVIKAVLLDAEARDVTKMKEAGFGKVREPVLRLTALLRAFGATSSSGRYSIGNTDQAQALGQTPLRSPSVFNFYRPGYVPPGSLTAGQNLMAPEMQIANESTIAGYASTIIAGLTDGFGPVLTGASVPDVQLRFGSTASTAVFAKAPERALDPAQLAEYLNQHLLYGRMSADLRADIVKTVGALPGPDGLSDASAADAARKKRIATAVAMVAVSPEFLVQK